MNHFDPQLGAWQAEPSVVYEPALGLPEFGVPPPDIEFDPHGNGLIVFEVTDPEPVPDYDGAPNFRVAAMRFDAAAGSWSSPAAITPHATDIYLRDQYKNANQLVVSANGAAMVMFYSGFGLAEATTSDPSGTYCVFE